MSTKIEWTDETWNPLSGCTKVSPGCDHCYAKTMHERFNGPGSFDTVTLHPQRLDQLLRWRRPRRVFVNSMSDLFHEDVPDEYIARVWAVMAMAYRHTFQILTKRHARMRALLNSPEFVKLFDREYCGIPDWATRWPDPEYAPSTGWHLGDGPLRNVWLGVSVEDQKWADNRIPALLDTPAAVRFISAEPLLGPVSMFANTKIDTGTLLDWVIVGGESGHGARPMHPGWARHLRNECAAYGIPFLFKQWGEFAPQREWDGIETMRRVGKKAAGRELDGRTWDQYPEVAA